MHFIRETPWYVFYPLVLATLGCLVAFFQFMRTVSPSKQMVCAEAQFIARRLSAGRYNLKQKKRGLFGITLGLETADLERKKEVIKFFRRHPDCEQVKQLARLEVIEFEYTAPVRGVGETEVSAYLRLKCA